MSFVKMGLDPRILSAVEEAGYTNPTPIQTQAIPIVLEGRDVLGIAQTGTGKTASFTLPMIHRLMRGRAKARMPRTLILEPTRELATQVAESFDLYGKNTKLTKALLIGGVGFDAQEKAIMRGADVLIATPGRLLDHVARGKVLLRGVEILVIDEADRMLDMGFIPDIEKILKFLSFTRQTLFFSATMPPEITQLAEQFLSAPARIEVAPPASPTKTVEHKLVTAQRDNKRDVLRHLLRRANVKNGIIFCNRKRDIGALHESLVRHGFSVTSLHGDMNQYKRLDMLDQFRKGEVQFLIASDVAARGLDISNVSHVFNFDVPTYAEDYIHRIGRTGRAGKSGQAFTIMTEADIRHVEAIEKLLRQPIARESKFANERQINEKQIEKESPRAKEPRNAKRVDSTSQHKGNHTGRRRGLAARRSDKSRSGKPRSDKSRNSKPQRDKPQKANPKLANHKLASYKVASHKVASHKVTNHKVANHKVTNHKGFGGDIPSFMQTAQ
ncbi:MAG: DEAD/DEAH box helicase, partial [Alphaproteobacteria bacterium]|nr:DEAD/DEAH box helicase [Alphaproteobacteria bacterium]